MFLCGPRSTAVLCRSQRLQISRTRNAFNSTSTLRFWYEVPEFKYLDFNSRGRCETMGIFGRILWGFKNPIKRRNTVFMQFWSDSKSTASLNASVRPVAWAASHTSVPHSLTAKCANGRWVTLRSIWGYAPDSNTRLGHRLPQWCT
jgi:hypothetical protein